MPALALLAAGLALASARRDADYSSEESILLDTISKVPTNPRAHSCLGRVLATMPGRLNDAIAGYEEALRLKPGRPGGAHQPGRRPAESPGAPG